MLKSQFPTKAFTIDGRLVGDLGEIITSLEYDLTLYDVQAATHDGETSDGRKVQVKATFKDKLTITAIPELYLGFQLSKDGTYREIFNGPGFVIAEQFSHRKGIGEKQLSFPIATLEQLSKTVDSMQRVQKRKLK
ncbi:MAG TPA: hypothetical protein DFK12_06355 [Gallionellaceae bacterium]|nr:hypothetical protein [Gallionellaceae bacterium]